MINLNKRIEEYNKNYMASAADFCEDNGAAAGSPAKGTSRTFRRNEINFKAIDDSVTAYSASPITTGNNSFEKWQFLAITGTFNQISAGQWGHTTGILGAGLRLLTVVTSGYHSPTTTALSSGVEITLPSGLSAASQTVFFSPIGPEAAGQTGTVTFTSGYSSYFPVQMLTTTLANPGDSAVCTFSCSYTEN